MIAAQPAFSKNSFFKTSIVARVRILMLSALGAAALLLLSNAPFLPDRLHKYVSALPLAMAGIAYALLQLRLNPPRATLLKRLMLAATFVTWAIDQVLPAGPVATFLGDVVIGAYVLDLYWLIGEQISAVNGSRHSIDGQA